MPRTASVSLSLVLMCVCCVEQRVCFPNGSVASSCGSLMPAHPPFSPSARSPPFTLSTSSTTYRPGGVVTGTCVLQRSHSSVI
uniref:Secreted protein n=1 Tax=Scophthalmus maximus TaxID=52904 RepID=A0A8D3BD24_SCOMX